jgi:hypothetical protein
MPRRDQLHVVEADADELDVGELQLRAGRHWHLSSKPVASGLVKPACGQHGVTEAAVDRIGLRCEKRGFRT